MSLHNAVDAANSIMIGPSMTNEIGNAMLPNAARLAFWSGIDATNHEKVGPSAPINNQLAAKGSHS
jgi:hypothetical protein